MLMRIREQKGWIRGIFIALILVFASSFVIGGVGSGGNFSLSDIIGSNSGSSSSTVNSSSVTSLLKQIKLHPKDATLWSQLSNAYQTDSRLSDAVTAAAKAVKLSPNNVENRKVLANLYQAQANDLNTQAQTLYGQAYTLQQQDPASSPFNAVSPTSTSPLASAIQSPFTQSASNAISVQIAQLQAKSSKLAAQAQAANQVALDQYRTIVNTHTNDAQSWLSYASAAEQLGNNATALKGYKEFLRLVPADPIAPQVTAKVKSLEKTIAAAKKKAATPTTTSPSSTTTTTTTKP
jgi:cytochrome c-type biogenesis protein CcmH/NrfG